MADNNAFYNDVEWFNDNTTNTALSDSQAAFADKYGLNYDQAVNVNSDALAMDTQSAPGTVDVEGNWLDTIGLNGTAADFDNFKARNNIDDSVWNGLNDEARKGVISSANAEKAAAANEDTNWGMDGWGGVGLGVINSAITLAGYNDAHKNSKLERQDLGNKIAADEEKLKNYREDRAHGQSVMRRGYKA